MRLAPHRVDWLHQSKWTWRGGGHHCDPITRLGRSKLPSSLPTSGTVGTTAKPRCERPWQGSGHLLAPPAAWYTELGLKQAPGLVHWLASFPVQGSGSTLVKAKILHAQPIE